MESFRETNEEKIHDATYGFKVKEKKINSFSLSMIDSPGYGDRMDLTTWRHHVISEI